MWSLRTSVLVLSVLLCTLAHTAGSSTSSSPSSSSSSSTPTASPSEMRSQGEELLHWIKHSNITSNSQRSRPPSSSSPSSSPSSPPPSSSSSKLKEVTGHAFPSTTSSGTVTTVTSQSSDSESDRSLADRVWPHCAYRVMEGGVGGQLCFRDTVSGFRCGADCTSVLSRGNMAANIFPNGSVLLQWSHEGESKMAASEGAGLSVLRPGGFELSCWWNGSYTQFECAGVHLGSGCRDFLLTQLHQNIPYRLCLRPLGRAEHPDCVEFTLPSSGMQDIVIAMTTVGGAICVMLVIICLLVAYITENIMSPATQHSYSYRTHSHH